MRKQPASEVFFDFYQTRWGRGVVASSDGCVVRILLPWAAEDELLRDIDEHLNVNSLTEGSEDSLRVARELERYFAGERVNFTAPSAIDSLTPFQKKVSIAAWSIPYGEVRTYKWLAEQAGSRLAFRAAGQVMARNALPVIIPCHRVLGHSGLLGGFSCGLEWKRRLLDVEGVKV